jgi:hypothetical protein
MQQTQLVRVAPSLATASVALNTSAIYLGQALGALVGAELFAKSSWSCRQGELRRPNDGPQGHSMSPEGYARYIKSEKAKFDALVQGEK